MTTRSPDAEPLLTPVQSSPEPALPPTPSPEHKPEAPFKPSISTSNDPKGWDFGY